jgi:hypothetical protein
MTGKPAVMTHATGEMEHIGMLVTTELDNLKSDLVKTDIGRRFSLYVMYLPQIVFKMSKVIQGGISIS